MRGPCGARIVHSVHCDGGHTNQTRETSVCYRNKYTYVLTDEYSWHWSTGNTICRLCHGDAWLLPFLPHLSTFDSFHKKKLPSSAIWLSWRTVYIGKAKKKCLLFSLFTSFQIRSWFHTIFQKMRTKGNQGLLKMFWCHEALIDFNIVNVLLVDVQCPAFGQQETMQIGSWVLLP